ncbi:glycoside hydrolase family 125 protein [Sporosarcina jiandibaonis]|uniref:glycoside hydrolase family 125 protein n=1 Tax=Sporosarcina jiandibaonis TaxID=2715535 RepID=UPI0015546FBC|nr:glycoside hydrolase family 125 protein [Sporosarcina jiandibaonis]
MPIKARNSFLEVNNTKNIDIGTGKLTASIARNGKFTSINTLHQKFGYITLTAIEQFPNEKWYDSQFVRKYRNRIASNSGFGTFHQSEKPTNYGLTAANNPVIEKNNENEHIISRYFAIKNNGIDFILQEDVITNTGLEDIIYPLCIGGTFSLNRSSYGQLTEGGPILIPDLINDVAVSGNKILIENKNLAAKAEVSVFINDQPLTLKPFSEVSSAPIDYFFEDNLFLKQGESKTVSLIYRVSEIKEKTFDLNISEVNTLKSSESIESNISIDQFVINQNINYIKNCCAVPVDEKHICVITDHQLLPLSWNRDAYYMIKLLLDAKKEKLAPSFDIQEIVKGHLQWMFNIASRPEGHWGRAYVTNGFCKDNAFQLDQQCYPLLEIYDYHQSFGDEETVQGLLKNVDAILDMILTHRHKDEWLFETGETPADDEVEYPYHFSSQVLIWRTLTSLAILNERFSFTTKPLATWAENIQRDCLKAFTIENRLFAYLVDLKGNYRLYHDANDLPTVYAPIWGFCSSDDPIWKATMEFAFTEENIGGFYPGSFAGLGSIHTPHPWPLGDGQELLYSHLIGDENRKEKVLEKLKTIVQWDGLFSEAISEQTGKVTSRYWFSWPGSFISSVLLQLKKEK